MTGSTRLAIVLAAAATLLATRTLANPTSETCTTLIAAAEQRYQIPAGVLMAIALTESGREGRPHPMAMNIAGRAHFADSLSEMAAIVRRSFARGVRSIDVGCMQVNLKHHGHRFADPLMLTDPATNIDYAARYLVDLAAGDGSWKSAVMSYHNRMNPARRRWYGCSVWNSYLTLVGTTRNRLACGRAPAGSSTAARPGTGAAPPRTPTRTLVTTTMAGTTLNPVAPALPAQGGLLPSPARERGRAELVVNGSLPPRSGGQDQRAGAFAPVRPTAWSDRLAPSAQPDLLHDAATAGFGHVSADPS